MLRRGLALVREFSCRDREFDVAIGLDKTNSFSVAIVWRCVARDREGQARYRQGRVHSIDTAGAHDRGSLS